MATCLSACGGKAKTRYLSEDSFGGDTLSETTLGLNASVPPITNAVAAVLTDNDTAFEQKISAIKKARETLDLAYYIYADDSSSAVFSEALIDAARRGVRVRLLLDYFSNYERLDHFSMMESEGSSGNGSLEVRFYNRPSINVIRDAVYLTLGCGSVAPEQPLAECSAAKYAGIDLVLNVSDPEQMSLLGTGGTADPLNYNSGGSGLFLSGLYSRNLELLILAVTEGQALELGASRTDAVPRRIAAEDLDRAIQFATIYWKARPGNPKRLAQLGARLKLDLAFGLYGDKLNPVFDALTAYAPVEYRRGSEASLRDWGHFTDFLHHKLLLADDRVIVLGGRNVENAYHMRQNPEVQGYVFRDTDLYLRAEDGSLGLAASFGKLWNFRTMVATLEDVRLHAPNDVLVATRQANAACAKLAVDPEQESTCQASLRASGIDLQTRLDQAYQHMVENEAAFRERYIPAEANQRNKTFTIDGGAAAYYLENLPFAHDTPAPAIERLYGAKNGREGESGKHIHEVWLAAMRKSCADASPENSKEVIFHSAYFFPPSNLLRQMADMVDGTLDCSNVTLKVLTNSPGTTDLNIINLFALPWLSAFGDYYNTERDPARGARFAYYEYLPEWLPDHRPAFSLHSKVMVFGDEVYVGSANTDVRSYMMDTNNGFYVRQAPEFAADYRRWLKEQLSDPGLVEDKTEIVLNATPEQIRAREQEALQKMIDGIIGGTSLEHRLPTEHVLERLLGVLDHVHDLTAEILREDTAESDAVRQFNALYRLI